MLDADLKTEVLHATEARLAENVDLHAALLPMAPKTHGGVNHGDSLARVLLNVTCVQQEVAALLLQKLPELVVCAAAPPGHMHTRSTHSTHTQGAAVVWWLASAEPTPRCGGGGAPQDVDGGGGDANLAALILAQLRWLDHIVSSGELVTTVLEVRNLCLPPPASLRHASSDADPRGKAMASSQPPRWSHAGVRAPQLPLGLPLARWAHRALRG